MPTYEYACSTCGHRFDIWQEVKAPAPACEKCGAETKKIFHPSRVIFKGPGFYVTDLASEKSGGKTKEGGESSKDDSNNSGKDSTKESAPAESKSESKESTPASTSGASSAPSSTSGEKK